MSKQASVKRRANRQAVPAAAGTVARAPAMFSPAVDAFCVGGGSIVLVLALLLLDIRVPPQETLAMAAIAYLLNAPHFMASYKLLYGAKDRLWDYTSVSVFMPTTLFLFTVYALVVYGSNTVYLEAMFGAGLVLLAWHYTGQAWGMSASYAYVDGMRFSPLERRLLRANLYTLLGWHVSWAIVKTPIFSSFRGADTIVTAGIAQQFYDLMTVVGLASSLLGLAALVLLTRRTGRPPTLRMVLPWMAIHMWYVLMYRDPFAIFWVQMAHALQYLVFPLRVELNRKRRERGLQRVPVWSGYMLRYYGVLFVLGVVVLGTLPDVVQAALSWLQVGSFTTDSFGKSAMTMAVVGFINIHHYFIDNVIWKIRNPVVRDDLFSHLQET